MLSYQNLWYFLAFFFEGIGQIEQETGGDMGNIVWLRESHTAYVQFIQFWRLVG